MKYATTVVTYQIIPRAPLDHLTPKEIRQHFQVRSILLFGIAFDDWRRRHSNVKIWRREDIGRLTPDEMLAARDSFDAPDATFNLPGD